MKNNCAPTWNRTTTSQIHTTKHISGLELHDIIHACPTDTGRIFMPHKKGSEKGYEHNCLISFLRNRALIVVKVIPWC